ncbi:MAG: hypothetical protein ACREB3_16075, partial [Burkholderiales bacterium]
MLVTAIIVVLPMVLDLEPRPVGQAVSVQIPSPDSGAFASKVVPLPAAPGSKPAPKAVQGKPAAAPPADEPKKIAAAPEPPAPVTEAPKETP